MSVLREYEVYLNGLRHTFQMTDEHAKRVGGKLVEKPAKKQVEAEHKERTVSNKARSTQNKKG